MSISAWPKMGAMSSTKLLRLTAFVVGFDAGVLFGLAAVLHHRVGPVSIDRWLHGQLVRGGRTADPELGKVAFGLAHPAVVVAVAVVLTALAARRWRTWAAAAVPLASVVIVGALDQVLKQLVHRTTPDGALDYPSGHAAGASAIGLLLVLVLPAAVRIPAVVVALVLTGTVVGGAMATQAHYATALVGGVALGTGVVAALSPLLSRSPASRRGEPRPAPGAGPTG